MNADHCYFKMLGQRSSYTMLEFLELYITLTALLPFAPTDRCDAQRLHGMLFSSTDKMLQQFTVNL